MFQGVRITFDGGDGPSESVESVMMAMRLIEILRAIHLTEH